ncbi:GSCFA domain-containing protein [Leisingera sp. ANG-Vp]|uniref:GSCFA domain-containing protein n=1 Tax=Leisingera sp. ANG-Vp TaxID=1577896 RepID=UPI000580532D|nr:GSCFA domain-containing protein [Leisingera sp. ANG-Vp]KIC17308.1 hypothetical protein RA20_15525 [Leisingera sp. ANG-Vp]
MSSSPYENVPVHGFWRSGVAEQNPLEFKGLYKRKFRIRRSQTIATAGSCFAQHIARHLRARKFNVPDYEPAPRGMRAELARKYQFGIYSCRYGNIYTAAQLLQLAREAFGHMVPSDRVWERDGRYFDAQRPNAEPEGFENPEQVLEARKRHLESVRQMLLEMDIFVFTFGLTESWQHRESGTVFPTAPGTIAGTFDPKVYEFRNFTHSETLQDFVKFKRLLKRERAKTPQYIVSVSPVPLTATATGQHVLAASTYSKSVLRAVAGELFQTNRDVDYFPSYEIITAPVTRGIFFEPNQRSVSGHGVETAMQAFFSQHDPGGHGGSVPAPQAQDQNAAPADEEDSLICEEILLENFSR